MSRSGACAVCGGTLFGHGLYVYCFCCERRSYDGGVNWTQPPRPEVTRTVEEDDQ